MLEKEKIIQERRNAEAIDKNYLGLEGKFGTILRYLGNPIITHDSFFDQTDIPDVYDLPDDNQLPTQDEDMLIREVGGNFDGLKYGYHLEIRYLQDGVVPLYEDGKVIYEQAFKILSVYYKGYLVYLEAEGELKQFSPAKEWEEIIEKIYKTASKLQKQQRIDHMDLQEQIFKENKMSLLAKLRAKWGI